MSRFVTTLKPITAAPTTAVSTPTSPTSHSRSKSIECGNVGRKRNPSETSSGLKLPFYTSIQHLQYSQFVADLQKANPGRAIGQQQADEAKDVLVRRIFGSTTVEKARQAERQGKGRTPEGDAARLESMRLRGESAKYWDDAERKGAAGKEGGGGESSKK